MKRLKIIIFFASVTLLVLNVANVFSFELLNDSSTTITSNQTTEITLTGVNFDDDIRVILFPHKDSTFIANFDTPYEAVDICIRDSIAYVPCVAGKVRVIDISNPKCPNEINILDIALAIGVTLPQPVINNNNIYFSSFSGFYAINSLSPSSIQYLFTDSIFRSNVVNNIAYCAGQKGLTIIEVTTDLNSLKFLSRYNPDEILINVLVDGNIAYLSVKQKRLEIIDVTNPAEPQLLSKINSIQPLGTIVQDNKLYIGSESGYVYIYDVTFPKDPKFLSKILTPGLSIELEKDNNFLYVADFSAGIQIIDIKNIYNPDIIWSYKNIGDAYRIKLKKNIGFIACGNEGLLIINLPMEIFPHVIEEDTVSLSLPALSSNEQYTLRIMNNNQHEDISVLIEEPKLVQISPPHFDFGTVDIQDSQSYVQAFEIINITNQHIDITSIFIEGNSTNSFSIVNNSCLSQVLFPQSICNVQIEFKPKIQLEHQQSLIIEYINPVTNIKNIQTALLSGTGSININYKFERMWPVVKKDWYFNAPAGVTTDKEGYVYIADMGNHRILKFTNDGRRVAKWGRKGSEDGMLNMPSDIIFDEKDSVYVVDRLNNRIQKFSLFGNFVCKWGKRGVNDGEFIFPFAITIDSKGFIYIADRGNDRIQKFDSDGTYISQWGKTGTNDGEFYEPMGITCYDSNGMNYIFVIDKERHIQKFNENGEFVKSWEGDNVINLTNGRLAADKDGNIYVLHNKITKYDFDGNKIGQWGEEDGAFQPIDICFDDLNEVVYVTDFSHHYVNKYNFNGQLLAKWGSSGSDENEFNEPTSIACDDNNLYIIDKLNHRIQKYSVTGEFIDTYNGFINSHYNFFSPNSIAINNNYIYITDSDRFIKKFNIDGEMIAYWEYRNADSYINSIAVSKDNLVYVTDNANACIKKYKTTGEFINKWGKKGSEHGEFNKISDIAVDDEGFIYAVDLYNNRTQKFDPDGNFLLVIDGSDEEKFLLPYAMTTDRYNNFYIAHNGYRILKFSSSGEYLTSFGEYGAGTGQFNQILDLCTDDQGVLYVTDNYNRIQTFREKVWTGGKAIIVAGGGSYNGNNIWDDTLVNANFAYHSLTMQGFTKDTIYYLNSKQEIDIDDNGHYDDVDKTATNENLQYAITEWADNTDNLIIYLVNHGGVGNFQMRGIESTENRKNASDTDIGENLTVKALDEWLTIYQKKTSGKIVIIYDACHSGSFLKKLSSQDSSENSSESRIIITSSKPDENAIFVSQGSISFSSFFWAHISNGLNIGDSFENAMNSMLFQNQSACIDSNANGQPNEPIDINIAQNINIGNGVEVNDDAPIISNLSEHQTLESGTTATISAFGIKDPDGIESVKAIIRPPFFNMATIDNPIKDFPSIDLYLTTGDSYEGDYTGVYDKFNISGTYDILVYATDKKMNMSVPSQTSVTFINPSRRRAIIAIGNSQWETPMDAIAQNAILAYNALKFQKYSDDDIYFLSQVAYENVIVDDIPNKKNLQYALNEWATVNTQDLLVYLIGDGDYQNFLISKNEKINGNELNDWLLNIEDNIPGMVSVVYDACQAKSLIDLLIENSSKRMLIASTGSCNPAYFSVNGNISFSHTFWTKIWEGQFLSDAFNKAKNTIQVLRKDQEPFLWDPDHNSRIYIIGFGIKLGDISPLSGSVTYDMYDDTSAQINANVTSINNIDNVWAYISEPESPESDADPTGELGFYCGILAADLPAILLQPLDSTGKYSGTYDGFNKYGLYTISIRAKDKQGNLSSPEFIELFHDKGPDIYENDNDTQSANVIHVDDKKAQQHNFHASDDIDFVKFHVFQNETYTIEVKFPEHLDKPALNLHFELLQNEKTITSKSITSDSLANSVDLTDWYFENEGIVYLKFSNSSPYSSCVSTGYDLFVKKFDNAEINNPSTIRGKIFDFCTNELIVNALIKTNASLSSISESEKNPNYSIANHPSDSVYNIFAEAYGYENFSESIKINESEETIIDIPMIQKTSAMRDVILILKSISGYYNQNTDDVCLPEDFNNDHKLGIDDAIFGLQKKM